MSLRGVLIWGIGCVLLTVVVVRYQLSQARVPLVGSEATAAAAGSAAKESVFEDVAATAGVEFTYRSGEESDFYTILESLGGGVALLDYDGDGLLDLFFTGGGRFTSRTAHGVEGLPGRLFRNQGQMRFRDVTIESGLSRAGFYSHGALVLDWDQDGRPDLLISGYGGLLLYRNEDGRGFQDVTPQSGLTDGRWSTSVAAGDLWGRGRADLFVCRYVDWTFQNDPECPRRGQSDGRDVCAPQNFAAVPSSVYSHEGAGGVYRDHWDRLQPAAAGKALGVVIVDVNADGRPDVYVANDASANWLFLNEGNGQLRECGRELGVSVDDSGRYNGSMGVDASDYDGSGRSSLWVTNFESELPALYRNAGAGGFAYASQSAGVGRLGGRNVGFGTSFLDYDNDGWEDLVFVNGHVVRHPVGAEVRQSAVLLRNTEQHGRRMFVDESKRGGAWFQRTALGRGLATGDLDNDGWPDLVVSHSNSAVAVLRNRLGGVKSAGGGGRWLGLQLMGRGHRPLAGATVTVQIGDRKVTRFIRGGGSYLSSGDCRVLVGLGESEKISGVAVRWPWGETQTWGALDLNRYWLLREGVAEAADAAGVAIGF